jgi:hypothetical protein
MLGDGCSIDRHLGLQALAQAAQMAIKALAGQELGQHPVGQRRQQLAMHRAQPQPVAPADDMAEAEARPGDAGEAATVKHPILGIEDLQRPRPDGAAVQLAHHVALDQRQPPLVAAQLTISQLAALLAPALAGLLLLAIPELRPFLRLEHEQVKDWYGRRYPQAFAGPAPGQAASASSCGAAAAERIVRCTRS